VLAHIAAAKDAGVPLPPNEARTLSSALVSSLTAGHLAKGTATSVVDTNVTVERSHVEVMNELESLKLTAAEVDELCREAEKREEIIAAARARLEQPRLTH
jgi:hypothetical protein